MTELAKLSDDQILRLPIDRLALLVLAHCHDAGEWNTYNFLNGAQHRGVGQAALACLSEAMNWLVVQGLIARDKPGQSSAHSMFVTRAGQRVLSEGITATRAAARLGVDLHERLAKVRTQFLICEYELAAFAAMREVEIRVRELAKAEDSLLGVKLMRTAFKPEGGPLAGTNLDAGERVGMMELFAGAIGTFKNPPSHRQVDYGDPTEASEVVMLADLLMRLLDRVAVG
ncbi:MAG: TIGR02391 family protein [Kineosporiaceae bacterium]